MTLPYRALWRRELNAGLYGQNPDVPSTWKLDHLWRAALAQRQAEETEQSLQDVLDYPNPHPDTVRHFLEKYERQVAECHRIFLEGEEVLRAA